MSKVMVNSFNLTPIENEGKRVLTTAQLAEAYGTDSKTISYNFNHNKKRYTEGKHYYCLTGDALKASREIHDLPKNINTLYLWTEKGSLLHAKSLNTDKAWEVYDFLVENYFRVQQMQKIVDSYMIDDPIKRAERWIEERKEYIALKQKSEQDKPLVEFVEHIQVSDDCISMGDMAKLANKNGVKIGRNRLFAFLRSQKVLKQDNIPYQRYIESQSWFQVKESVYDTANFTRICLTTMVTPTGQKGIIRMLKNASEKQGA